MRGGRCLKVWTKKQKVSCTPQSKARQRDWGIESVAQNLGMACGLNLHPDASATVCLVNRRGLGKAKHVGMQNLGIQE